MSITYSGRQIHLDPNNPSNPGGYGNYVYDDDGSPVPAQDPNAPQAPGRSYEDAQMARLNAPFQTQAGQDWWAQNAPGLPNPGGSPSPATGTNGTGPGSNGNYQLAPDGSAPLMQNWTTQFQPRDPNDVAATDKSFQFQMDQGRQALEHSAASRGTLLTGGALKSLARFGQGLASTFDDKYYGRDLQQYQMAHDIYSQNQSGQFNRLSALAGMGQTSAGQLGNQGSSYANNAGNTMTDIGNAQAAGTVGGANAWNNALGQIANNTQYGYGQSSYPYRTY